MRVRSLIAAALLLSTAAPAHSASVARAAWDNRCEECHGDPDKFAAKYLWIIEGQLQGRHHVDDLRLFLGNHYVPEHLLDPMHAMMSKQASTLTRFDSECGECHGTPESFVRKSIVTQDREMIGVMTSTAVEEYLASHRELSEADAEFFTRLLKRVERIIYSN
jgi:cytochrome c5